MKNTTYSIIGAIIFLIITGTLFSIFKKNQTEKQTQFVNQPTTTLLSISDNKEETPIATIEEVKEITVDGSDYSFSPTIIEVKKGTVIKLTFKNNKGFHDWVVDEFMVRTKQLNAGQEETIQFTADKAGSFEFYCSVGKHREMGMKGTLIIRE